VPQRASRRVLDRLRGALLGCEPLARFDFRQPARLFGRPPRGFDLLGAVVHDSSESLELRVEGSSRSRRLGRRHERAGIELLVVPERALKPDAELARHA
jgi:hypothetical protein